MRKLFEKSGIEILAEEDFNQFSIKHHAYSSRPESIRAEELDNLKSKFGNKTIAENTPNLDEIIFVFKGVHGYDVIYVNYYNGLVLQLPAEKAAQFSKGRYSSDGDSACDGVKYPTQIKIEERRPANL